MIIRIFEGATWGGGSHVGDFTFDTLPVSGQKIAILGPSGWLSGQVKDVVHRIVTPSEAADIALLIDPVARGADDDAPLPLDHLDQLAGSEVPRRVSGGPWSAA